jgi:pantoate--beta-alanine ligase
VDETKKFVINEIEKFNEFRLEYFEISDSITLRPLTSWSSSLYPMGFIAVYLDDIRLIDNIKYF